MGTIYKYSNKEAFIYKWVSITVSGQDSLSIWVDETWIAITDINMEVNKGAVVNRDVQEVKLSAKVLTLNTWDTKDKFRVNQLCNIIC